MLWECMVISLKAGIGGILWVIVAILIAGFLGSIAYVITNMSERKKPKYEGKPIVVEGGKKNDNDNK